MTRFGDEKNMHWFFFSYLRPWHQEAPAVCCKKPCAQIMPIALLQHLVIFSAPSCVAMASKVCHSGDSLYEHESRSVSLTEQMRSSVFHLGVSIILNMSRVKGDYAFTAWTDINTNINFQLPNESIEHGKLCLFFSHHYSLNLEYHKNKQYFKKPIQSFQITKWFYPGQGFIMAIGKHGRARKMALILPVPFQTFHVYQIKVYVSRT